MKKSVKSTAILMALILALSVFASIAATTTVAADTTTQTAKADTNTPTAEASTAAAMATPTIVTATATTTTMGASNTNPAVGETITITVILHSGGTPLSKSVKVWHTTNGVRWEDGTHTTSTNGIDGVYSFTQAYGSVGQRVYHAEFAGDSQYAASSGTVMMNVGMTATTTTITASNPNPNVGETVIFSVNLKSGSTGLSKPVTIWHSWPGGDHTVDGTFNTVNGLYTFTQSFGSSGQRVYHAEFAGDSKYGASLGTVTVNVGMTATTTTITASNQNPNVNEVVTFTVNLKAGGTGLNDKPVKIWHITDGKRWEDGTHTTTNGVYTFSQTFGSAGLRTYHVEFAGDSMYKASANIVTVNVKLNPTTTTVTASPTNPTVGQTVTFTVNIKSGTTGLSKPVKIWHIVFISDMILRYEDGTHATTNGVYSFTQSFGSTGQRIYHAEFAGDSQYGASSGTVTVNVKAPTTTTITASETDLRLNEPVTFTVNLKSGTTPLNKPVKIWYTLNDVRTDTRTFNTVNGVYTFTQSYGLTGQRVFHAEFAGDSTYGASSGTVTVNVIY